MSEPLALLLLSSTGPQYSHYWTLDTFLGVLGTGPAAGGEGGRVRVGWDMAQGTLGVPGLHSPFSLRGRFAGGCWRWPECRGGIAGVKEALGDLRPATREAGDRS